MLTFGQAQHLLTPLLARRVGKIFVDQINGDDGAGDGSEGNPYLTLGRAVQDVTGSGFTIVVTNDSAFTTTNIREDPVIIEDEFDLQILGVGDANLATPLNRTKVNTHTAIVAGTTAPELLFTCSAAHNLAVDDSVFISGVDETSGNVIRGCALVTRVPNATQYEAIVHDRTGGAPFFTSSAGISVPLAISIITSRKVLVSGFRFQGDSTGGAGWGGVGVAFRKLGLTLGQEQGGEITVVNNKFRNAGLGFVGTIDFGGTQFPVHGEGNRVEGNEFLFFNLLGLNNAVTGANGPPMFVVGDTRTGRYIRNVFTQQVFAGTVSNLGAIFCVKSPFLGEIFAENEFDSAIAARRLFVFPGVTGVSFKRGFYQGEDADMPVDVDPSGDAQDREPLSDFGIEELPTQSDLTVFMRTERAVGVPGTFAETMSKNAFEEGAVWVDGAAGESGTAYPLGTMSRPVQSWSDAKAIAQVNNLTRIRVTAGGLALDSAADDFTFVGDSGVLGSAVTSTGVSMTNARFERVFFFGTLGENAQDAVFLDSRVFNLGGVRGSVFRGCALQGTVRAGVDWGGARFIDCFGPADAAQAILDGNAQAGAAGSLHVAGWKGGDLQFSNFQGTGSPEWRVSMSGGTVELLSSVNSPTLDVVVEGVGTVTDNSTAINSLDTSGLVAGINAAAVADAVWDELRAGHVGAGSFGEALDRRISSLFGGNTRTQLFFSTSAITGGREVPANAVSHMRVEIGDDAAPPDFTSPVVYFVVFNYAASDTASDAAKSSSIQAVAPTDGTFTSEPFPPAS